MNVIRAAAEGVRRRVQQFMDDIRENNRRRADDVDEYDPNARREFQPLNKEVISIRTTLKSCLEQGAMTAAEVVDFTNLMQLLCFEQSYGVRWMSLLLALTVVKDTFDAAILDNHSALVRFCRRAFFKFVDTAGNYGGGVNDPNDRWAATFDCLDGTHRVFHEVAQQGHIPGQLPYVDHCPGRAHSHVGAVHTYVVNVQNGLWMNVGTRLFHELKLPRYAFNVAGVPAGPYASLDGKRIRVVVYAILRRGRPPAAVAGFDIEDYPVIANYVRAFRARFTVPTRDNGRRPLLPDEELTDDILKTWHLFPICAIKRHNVRLDNHVLGRVFRGLGITARLTALEEQRRGVEALPEGELSAQQVAELVFDQRDGSGNGPSKQRQHAPFIATDGVGISCLYRRAGAEGARGRFHQPRVEEDDARPRDLGLMGPGIYSSTTTTPTATNFYKRQKLNDGKPKKRSKDDKVSPLNLLSESITTTLPGQEERWVIGLDPGRANIWFAYRKRDGAIFALTRKEYYHLSGIQRRNRGMATINKLLEQANLERTAASLKCGAYEEQMADAIRIHARCFAVCWEMYFVSHKQARLALHVHMGKRSALQTKANEFGNGLTPEQKANIVVGYGDGSFKSHGRVGELAVPVSKASMVVRNTWNTISVPEGYTTVTCHDCHRRLVSVWTDLWYQNRWGTICFKVNRGLKRCLSVICRSDKPFKGRDKNAAENIADVTEAVLDGAEHPRHLTREYHDQLRRGGLDA